MQEGQTTIDVSLVDAFIANCDDDDVFIRMVDSYGDKLTSKQCEILRKKSKNTTLLTNINSIADIKIVNAIKANVAVDYNGRKVIYVEEFYHLFKGIQDQDIKEKVFFETVEYIKGRATGRGYTKEWKELVGSLRVGCIIKCINEKGKYDDDLVDDFAHFVSGNDALVFLEKLLDYLRVEEDLVYGDTRINAFEVIMEKIDKKDYAKAIKLLPKKIYKARLSTAFKLIDTSDAAKEFLLKGFQNVTDSMISSAILMLSKEEKTSILMSAKERFEKNKDKICIGPFYLGMPYCDAVIIAEDKGYFKGKDNPLVSFGHTLNDAENESILKYKVCWMGFELKASLEFLDCEDAHVLQQAIRQCVKKQKGRANSWDYASEIKSEASLDSSTRINLFSHTGTTTDYSTSFSSEYKNTKLGIGLRYYEKTGALTFFEL
jgi:hypothetical protein